MSDRVTLEHTDEQGLETSIVSLRRRLFRPCSNLCPSGVVSTSEYIGEGGGGSGDSRPHQRSGLSEPRRQSGTI